MVIYNLSTLLSLYKIVNVQRGVKSLGDRRKIIDRYIVSYIDDEYNEYRKAFEVVKGAEPLIPDEGSDLELNDLKFQFSKISSEGAEKPIIGNVEQVYPYVDLKDEPSIPTLRDIEPYRRSKYVTYEKENGHVGYPMEYEMEG